MGGINIVFITFFLPTVWKHLVKFQFDISMLHRDIIVLRGKLGNFMVLILHGNSEIGAHVI